MSSDRKDHLTRQSEYEKLYNQYTALKSRLAALISERDSLVNTEGPNAEAMYLSLIGSDRLVIFYIESDVRQMKRKMELLQAAVNRNEQINLEKVDGRLYREFREWQEKLDDYARKVNNANRMLTSVLSDEESDEFRNIYLDLVEKLHPDVNPRQSKRENEIWCQVQKAYKTGNLQEMRVLSLISYADIKAVNTEKSVDNNSIEELKHIIEKIKTSTAELEAQIAVINNNYPLTLREYLQNSAQMEKEKSRLAEQKHRLLKYKNLLGFHLANLEIIAQNGQYFSN